MCPTQYLMAREPEAPQGGGASSSCPKLYLHRRLKKAVGTGNVCHGVQGLLGIIVYRVAVAFAAASGRTDTFFAATGFGNKKE